MEMEMENNGNSIVQLSGIGGEILISKIENFEKTKKEFQKKSSSELFQHVINDSNITIENKICHHFGANQDQRSLPVRFSTAPVR